MTILSADLVFFGAEYPLDVDYGGGRITGEVVIDGTANNVFPNVSLTDRAVGRVLMRKVYAAVVSENQDTLLGAQIDIQTAATDAGTDDVMFVFGSQATTRAQAAAALAVFPYVPGTPSGSLSPTVGTRTEGTSTALFEVGTFCLAYYAGSLSAVGVITARSGSGTYTYTFDRDFHPNSTVVFSAAAANPAAPKAVAVASLTATSGSTTVVVDRVEARVVPDMPTYPTAVDLFNPAGLALVLGMVPIFRVGDAVVLRDGATTEVARVSFVDYTGGLTFETALANSYSSGATVSAFAALGDMTSIVASSFSQQTWTRVFTDVIVGNPISANYNRTAGAITTSNLGAATDRWAIVFTSPTDFKLIGEAAGQIATGSTATDFSPTNPLTGAPLFTIDSAGWGSGWTTGNVLRFNTQGARVPFWLTRSISPSAPGSGDSVFIEIRGSV